MNSGFTEILEIFGLRKYESSVYETLVRYGPSDASQIAEKSGVPLPRIYSTLASLERRGYLHLTSRQPSIYRASHPGHVLRAQLASLRKTIEGVLPDVEQDYETSMRGKPITERFGFTTYGETGFTTSVVGMLSQAKNNFVGAIHDLSWSVDETILDLLKSRRRAKIRMRIIGLDNPDELENLDIFRAASGADVRSLPDSSLRSTFAVSDGSRVMITIGDPNLLAPDKITTVLINEPMIASIFQNTFETLWEKSEEVRRP